VNASDSKSWYSGERSATATTLRPRFFVAAGAAREEDIRLSFMFFYIKFCGFVGPGTLPFDCDSILHIHSEKSQQ
jgi:hypothetical protein